MEEHVSILGNVFVLLDSRVSAVKLVSTIKSYLNIMSNIIILTLSHLHISLGLSTAFTELEESSLLTV